MAYKKSTKEQNQKIKAKEKTNTKELLDEEKIKEKGKDGRQEIRKLLEKGKISSGEARIRFGKLETKTETVQKGKLPSGRVEMTESSKKLFSSCEVILTRCPPKYEDIDCASNQLFSISCNSLNSIQSQTLPKAS